MAVPIRVRHFTVQEFHRMTAAGILTEDDRLELIDGEITEMAPIGPRHASCVIRLPSLLAQQVIGEALLSIQNPVQLNAQSELYPDVCLLRLQAAQYRTDLPGPEDVLLLIEVADRTFESDRDIKVPLYGQSGIVEVWVVDLTRNVVHVYTNPTPDGYRSTRVFRENDFLQVTRLPGCRLTVESILS